MLPSDRLRKIISAKHRINLEAHAWSKDFRDEVFKIEFLDGYSKSSLKTIFDDGYNIGNCLLTANYVSSVIPEASICTGRVDILKGTKNSPKGDHVWIETDDEIIDTTLMISVDKENYISSHYELESRITPHFLPDEISYQSDIYSKQNYPEEYYLELYSTNSTPEQK